MDVQSTVLAAATQAAAEGDAQVVGGDPTHMTMDNASLIATQLCGTAADALDHTTSQFPKLPETSLTHHTLGKLPHPASEMFAQTLVAGCRYVLILTMLEGARPVIIMVPTDARLHAAQRYIQVVRVAIPQRSWRMAHDAFAGTVLFGVRHDKMGLVLHDVAVSAGYTFVGSTSAPFTDRMEVLQKYTHLLQNLLKGDGWCFHMAPFQPCGINKPMRIPTSTILPRGLWLVHQRAAVESARHLWLRHIHVRMVVCGNQWFTAGPKGAMADLKTTLPTVHTTMGSAGVDMIKRVCPSSVGVFEPRIEHNVTCRDGSVACRRFLVLTKLHEAPDFRDRVLGPWLHIAFNTDTHTRALAAFAALAVRLRWTILENYLLHGIPAPKHARPGRPCNDKLSPSHSCTFTAESIFDSAAAPQAPKKRARTPSTKVSEPEAPLPVSKRPRRSEKRRRHHHRRRRRRHREEEEASSCST